MVSAEFSQIKSDTTSSSTNESCSVSTPAAPQVQNTSTNPFEDEIEPSRGEQKELHETSRVDNNPFSDDVSESGRSGHASKQQQEKSFRVWPLEVARHDEDHPADALPLYANVYRLTESPCGPGLRRHDRRALRLVESRFDIFDKASVVRVKTKVDVLRDIEDCMMLPCGKRLAINIRRLPKGVSTETGVWDNKQYYFEFDNIQDASSFHDEICRLQHAGEITDA